MSNGVVVWWYCLCAIAAINLVVWSLSAVALKRRRDSLPPEVWAERRQQLLLSALYVLGCGFRSVFPVFDVPRLGVVDSWLSSAFIGRSVATVAELAFAAQWALIMRETARATGNTYAWSVSYAVLPMIAVAEAFSWYSVLSTSNLGHVIEESLWALSAALVLFCMVKIRPRCAPMRRSAVIAWCVAGVAYVSYMVLVDVPMYWERWLADEASGRQYLSLAQGVVDAATRRVVTQAWSDWSSEVGWMTLYFSVGVWISLSLIHAPVPQRRPATRRRERVLPSLIYR